jgi:DNA (cytosine-5)-methyltransferase 1
MGYYRAGFDIIGIDTIYQYNYPFEFERIDVFEWLGDGTSLGVDAIHASPPCQRWTRAPSHYGHPDLVTPTQEILRSTGLPYVIENVPGAPLADDSIVLCGTTFGLGAGGYELRRHRLFEANFPISEPKCHHSRPAISVFGSGSFVRNGNKQSIEMKREAMGIDWMNRDELSEAVPPAYTNYIGKFLLEHLGA